MSIPCRLCGGAAAPYGRGTVLAKYDVGYFLCDRCGSLQTEEPYWLGEAYSRDDVDLGACQRAIDSVLRTTTILEALALEKTSRCVDFGGGRGLFARMMRDRGYDFWSYDRYSKSLYVPDYSLDEPPVRGLEVLTAFEVLEHFADPRSDLQQIFGTDANIVVLSTELFRGQDMSWDYLAQAGGQHVFFFSPKAMASVGMRFGYKSLGWSNLQVFVRGRDIGPLEFIKTDPAELFRRGLRLFVEHQRSPYRWIEREQGGAATLS